MAPFPIEIEGVGMHHDRLSQLDQWTGEWDKTWQADYMRDGEMEGVE